MPSRSSKKTVKTGIVDDLDIKKLTPSSFIDLQFVDLNNYTDSDCNDFMKKVFIKHNSTTSLLYKITFKKIKLTNEEREAIKKVLTSIVIHCSSNSINENCADDNNDDDEYDDRHLTNWKYSLTQFTKSFNMNFESKNMYDLLILIQFLIQTIVNFLKYMMSPTQFHKNYLIFIQE